MPGLLLEASLKEKYQRDAKAILTVLERTKFRDMVRPGDTLRYRAEVRRVNADGGKATAQASCGDGESWPPRGMVFAFKYVDDPQLEARRAALLKMWMQPVPERNRRHGRSGRSRGSGW